MNLLNLAIKYSGTTAELKAFAAMVDGNYGASANGLANLLAGLVKKTLPIDMSSANGGTAIEVMLGGVAASSVGTFTGQPSAADTLTLGGQAFTARASGAIVNEFNIGATTQATAQNLVAAINASTTEAVADTVFATYADLSTVKSTGSIFFTGQPSNDETVTVNGTVFTFKTSGATGNQANIGASTSETVDNLLYALQATTSSNIKTKMTFAKQTHTGTQATTILTMTGNPSNTQTFTIGTTVFTAKTSGASGDEFNITTANPTTTATALVNAFNDSDNVNSLFSASAGANAGDFASVVLTLTGLPTANDTFVINGVTFTAVAGAPTGNQFQIGADESATAANIVTRWNLSTTPGAIVITASAVAGAVTFTSDVRGSFANAFTSTESMDNATIASATFTGGTDSIPITFTVTLPGSAGNAYASTETLSNATFNGTTFAGGADDIDIDITATQAGTVGTAYTLAESATNVTVSAATLTGGVDNVTVTVTSRVPGKIGNYYTVTESMNNFTITGSGKLANGDASDYYTLPTIGA